jgi:hypothetical protein
MLGYFSCHFIEPKLDAVWSQIKAQQTNFKSMLCIEWFSSCKIKNKRNTTKIKKRLIRAYLQQLDFSTYFTLKK